MKYSIIIPAYNSSKFINIPLDSLERQIGNIDFEVLIVNDGSTDDLEKVVKPYLKRNNTWKLINKKNGNWGSVINYVKNKKLANGKYITILDSDDYFKDNILLEVSKFNTDVIITGISELRNNKEKRLPVFFGKSKNIKIEKAFTPLSTPHGKFYKNDLFYKMVDLEEGIPYQDTVLYHDLISKARDIYYIQKPLAVWWIDREGNSTTQKWDEKRADLWLKTCNNILSLPKMHNESVSWILMYLWELNRNYKNDIENKIKLNTKLAKFKWLPFGARTISKLYFLIKTRKYRK